MQKSAAAKILLFIAIVLFWFAQYVYIPFQTPYLSSLGAASAFIGIILGAYGFSQMLLRIPVGISADIYRRHKAFIIAGAVCASLASVLRVLFADPAVFLVANLFSGTASSMWISFTVFYSSLFKENELKKAMGYANAANNGGILLGFITGTLVNGALGIKFVFIASVASGLLSLVCALLLKEDYSGASSLKVKEIVKTFKSPPLIFYSIIGALFQAVLMSTALSFTMSYAKTITSMEFELGVCSVIFMAVSVAVSLIISHIRNIKSHLLLCILFGFIIVYCAFVPLASKMWELYLLQIAAGIGNGGMMPLLMTAALSGGSMQFRSSRMGFFQSVYGVGMTLGPMLMGAVIGSAGYAPGYWVMAGICAVCITALILFKFKKQSVKPEI